MSTGAALAQGLEAALEVPVYETPINLPAVPGVVVTPAPQWVERFESSWCGFQWTYEVHVLATRTDVDGAHVLLEDLMIEVLRVAPDSWTPVRVQAPTVRDVGGVDVLATTVTYVAQLPLPTPTP